MPRFLRHQVGLRPITRKKPFNPQPQKLIRALNCNLRGEFAMEVKIPKLAASMLVPGAAKCTELFTLKASAWLFKDCRRWQEANR